MAPGGVQYRVILVIRSIERSTNQGHSLASASVASPERHQSALLDSGKSVVRLRHPLLIVNPKQFWAGSERVGGRTGGSDLLLKQEVVARRPEESLKL
jgi:hypothetical protein